MIIQKVLEEIVKSKEAIKKAEQKLKIIKARVSDLEKDTILHLQKGDNVEKGFYSAEIKQEEEKASISWKGIVIELKGNEYVETLLSKAERKSKDVLVVAERS